MVIMGKEENWEFWLYIAGQTPKSMLALENITKYSKDYIKVKYTIEVIDLLKYPHLAETDQIFKVLKGGKGNKVRILRPCRKWPTKLLDVL